MKRVLIAGIGNIFLGDDVFGCEVIRELSRRTLPADVEVIDFGIRSYDLAYALTEDHDLTILVDASPRGAAPGTVYLIEPELEQLEKLEVTPDGHTMNAVAVLQLARLMGGVSGKLFLVGCEPTIPENDSFELGLSEPVRQALPEAVAMIESLLNGQFNSKIPNETYVVSA